MTDSWWAAQFTIGNILTILSLAVSIGWQMRRLAEIEDDLVAIKVRQSKDAEYIAATYERKDVMAAMLQSINLQLHAIQSTLARWEARGETHRS